MSVLMTGDRLHEVLPGLVEASLTPLMQILLIPHLNCNCNPSRQKPPGTVLGPLSCFLPWDPVDVSQLDISLCADSYCGYCPSAELKRDAARLHLSLLQPVAGLLSCNDI